MKMKSTKLAIALLGSTAFGAHVDAAEFDWRMQTFMPAGSEAYSAFEGFAKNVEEMSGGRIEIQTMPEDAVVSGTELLEAVGQGTLDGQLGSVGYNAGQDPAFGVPGNFVSGYDEPWQVQAFFDRGGGTEIAKELYEQYDVCFVGPVFWQPESLPSLCRSRGWRTSRG